MRLLDRFRNASRSQEEAGELQALAARLRRQAAHVEDMRSSLCHRVLEQVLVPNSPVVAAATELVHKLLRFEGHFSIPEIDTSQGLPTTKLWELRALAKRRLAVLEHPDAQQRI